MFRHWAAFYQTRCKIVVRLQVHRIALPLRSHKPFVLRRTSAGVTLNGESCSWVDLDQHASRFGEYTALPLFPLLWTKVGRLLSNWRSIDECWRKATGSWSSADSQGSASVDYGPAERRHATSRSCSARGPGIRGTTTRRADCPMPRAFALPDALLDDSASGSAVDRACIDRPPGQRAGAAGRAYNRRQFPALAGVLTGSRRDGFVRIRSHQVHARNDGRAPGMGRGSAPRTGNLVGQERST
jgi:hypothetical protein